MKTIFSKKYKTFKKMHLQSIIEICTINYILYFFKVLFSSFCQVHFSRKQHMQKKKYNTFLLASCQVHIQAVPLKRGKIKRNQSNKLTYYSVFMYIFIHTHNRSCKIWFRKKIMFLSLLEGRFSFYHRQKQKFFAYMKLS